MTITAPNCTRTAVMQGRHGIIRIRAEAHTSFYCVYAGMGRMILFSCIFRTDEDFSTWLPVISTI